jgi:hypothetical protein
MGVALLLWLPIEDTSLITAMLFGTVLILWGAAFYLSSLTRRGKLGWYNYLLVGMAAGLLVGPLTALLMIFKIGLHGHEIPDFSFQQVSVALSRTPFWGLGGGLFGLGIGVWKKAGRNAS